MLAKIIHIFFKLFLRDWTPIDDSLVETINKLFFQKKLKLEITANKPKGGLTDFFYHRSSTVVPKDKQPDKFHCEKKGKRSKKLAR